MEGGNLPEKKKKKEIEKGVMAQGGKKERKKKQWAGNSKLGGNEGELGVQAGKLWALAKKQGNGKTKTKKKKRKRKLGGGGGAQSVQTRGANKLARGKVLTMGGSLSGYTLNGGKGCDSVESLVEESVTQSHARVPSK